MKLKFIPGSSTAAKFFSQPAPAKSLLPEWYKSIPVHMGGETRDGMTPGGKGITNLTIKGCVPFLDAMTTGYMITLPFDVEVRKTADGGVSFNWAADASNYIGTHPESQTLALPTPHGSLRGAFKWSGGWGIQTPKGYSSLFIHPMNRDDLPFRVLSGVVDTDMYTIPVQFPFTMLDFDGDILVIERGTPIVQILPFKRENWISEVSEFDQDELDKKNFTLYSKISRSYKKQFWKKKNYN